MSTIARRASQMKRLAVLQGEVKVSSNPNLELTTVLGSCVAICLYDETVQLGGMNHYLLSTGGEAGGQEKKYGFYAFEYLLNGILKRGGSRMNLQGKVFGGASIGGKFGNLGPLNAAFALETLEREGIKCVAQELGGSQARKLRFIPTTGEVKLMRITRNEAPEIPAAKPRKVPTQSPEFF